MLRRTQPIRFMVPATRGRLPFPWWGNGRVVALARRDLLARFALDAGGELLFAPLDAHDAIPEDRRM